MPTTIGWVGAGVMGGAMCAHLLEAGHDVSVHTRTKSKAQPLLEAGATWAPSPADAARHAEVVFTMVGTPADVREVVLGPDGVLAAAAEGAVLVDMTTSEPSLAEEIAEAAAAAGVASVDAPVSGGDVGARNGTLSIMAGGTRQAVDKVHPLLALMGSSVVHQGGPGAGQHTKVVNQILVGGVLAGMSEGLLYAERMGLEVEQVLESVSGGAAGSWSLTNYAPRILQGDFAPGFAVDHFIKDLGIALAEAREARIATPASALIHQLYVALAAQGDGDKGVHALPRCLQRLSPTAEGS